MRKILNVNTKPDSLKKTKPQDACKINVNEDHEIRYWIKVLNVSKETLVETIKEVGTSAAAVKKALKK